MKKTVRLLRACAVSLVLAALSPCLWGEDTRAPLSIKIDQIISRDYPDIIGYAVVENANGDLVQGLSPGLFRFRIDSMEYKTKTTITPFSMKESPIDYSILLSNSGIMDGEPLDFQKNAVMQFIDSMKASDTLSVYAIGEEATPVFEEKKKDGIDVAAVNALAVSAAQPRIYDSIITVVRKAERRTTRRKVIIVMSDGRDQNSRFTRDQLNNVLSECPMPVYSIGFKVLGNQSLSNLNEIADFSGGTYLYTPALKSIPNSLKTLASKITQCYVIEMRIKNLKADNQPHHLEITVDERDSYGKGQKMFVAVKVPVPKWVKWVVLALALFCVLVLVFLYIFLRIGKRKRMGITKRRCPVCHARMKDSWDSCPFCKYLPPGDKKKKKVKLDV